MFAMKFGLATLCLVVLLGVSGGAKLKQKKMPKANYLPQDVNNVEVWRTLDMVIAKEILNGTPPSDLPYFPIDQIESVFKGKWEDKMWYIVIYLVQSEDSEEVVSQCTVQFETPVDDEDVVVDSINISSFKCKSLMPQ